MKFPVTPLVVGTLVLGLAPLVALRAQDDTDPRKPVWAYAITPEMPVADVRGPQPRPARAGGAGANAQAAARKGGPPDDTLYTVPGSKFQFTMAQIRSTADPVDWFPEDHAPLPEVVTHGRPPVLKPCYSCHTLNGKGKPENAPVAGLPKDYHHPQLREFKNGGRDTADIHKPKDMLGLTQDMTDDDMEQAATYFSAMPWTPWIRVVEADMIPKVQMRGQAPHQPRTTTEPLGKRLVEANEDEKMEQLRSPHAGWVAYVPVGAIKKGEALVTTGGGKTVPCITCHGQDLRGIGTIPGLAGPRRAIATADLRLPAGHAKRRVRGADADRRREAEPRRHRQHHGVYGVEKAVEQSAPERPAAQARSAQGRPMVQTATPYSENRDSAVSARNDFGQTNHHGQRASKVNEGRAAGSVRSHHASFRREFGGASG